MVPNRCNSRAPSRRRPKTRWSGHARRGDHTDVERGWCVRATPEGSAEVSRSLRLKGSTGWSRADLVQILEADEHVPRLASVGGTQNPGQLELIDDPRRSAVADAHPSLQQRR